MPPKKGVKKTAAAAVKPVETKAKAAPVKKAPAKPAAKKPTTAAAAVQEEPIVQPEAEVEQE